MIGGDGVRWTKNILRDVRTWGLQKGSYHRICHGVGKGEKDLVRGWREFVRVQG